MQAETLSCPTCGAAIASDATQCRYCGSAVATVACPSCFGRAFIGSKFCSHCGSELEWPGNQARLKFHCPRCRTSLSEATMGQTTLRQCTTCGGVWVDSKSFDKIC